MAESTGYVLAAAGLVAANQAILTPAIQKKPLFTGFNWRIIPATAIAGLTLAGLEKLSPPFGKGLGVLMLLSVLLWSGNSGPSPVDNAIAFLGLNKGK